jgi:predicted phage terminase large subunit-like protein
MQLLKSIIHGRGHALTRRVWEDTTAGLGLRLEAGAGGAAADMLTWCREYFPHYFTLPPSRQHEYISARLERAARTRQVRMVIEGPRDSAKSTFGTFGYPLFAAAKELETYILLISETSGLSKKYLEAIAHELETNEDLLTDYPWLRGQGSTWSKDCIVTANGVRIEALGAGNRIRGRRSMQHRPSCVILDDPEGDEAAFSSVRRTRIREWFSKGLSFIGAPGTNYFVIGTRIHNECLTAHLTGMAGWESKSFRALETWPERMDLWGEWEHVYGDLLNPDAERLALEFYTTHQADMDAGSRVLWPERWSLYDLMKSRTAIGAPAFESEKQGNPIDPSKCEWNPDAFRGNSIWFDDWPTAMDCKVMALDPSKGRDDRHGDYQALIMLGVKDGILYVDADLRRQHMDRMIENFVETVNVFQPDVAVIEASQFQECLVRQAGVEAIAQQVLAPIEPLENGNVRKIVRIRRCGPYFTQHRVRYKRRSKGVALLLQQLLDFPNGDHDDGPDALEMAVRRAGLLLGIARGRRKVQDPG